MNLFCPKIDSDDFKEMLNAFGGEQESYAYHLWNENNGNPLYLDHKGDPSILFEDLLGYTDGDRLEAMRLKSTIFNYNFRDYFGDWITKELTPEDSNVYENGEPQMDNILDVKMEETKKPGHMDPRVQANIDVYGENRINDLNNQNVWDIEKELKLLNKKQPFIKIIGEEFKTKQLEGFSETKANALMARVRELGGYAFPVDVRMSDGTIKTGVGVGYRIGRPSTPKSSTESIGKYITIAGKDYLIKGKDAIFLRQTLKKIEAYNSTGMYTLDTLIDDNREFFNKNPYLLDAANLLVKNRGGQKGLRVKVLESDNGDMSTYMDYDFKINTIRLFTKSILEDPTKEGFLASFVHEVYHAFTYDTLHHPQTEADNQFVTAIKEIVTDLQKHNIVNNKYGIKDSDEFLSVFKTDPEFAVDLKKYSAPGSTKTFLQRFIDALTTLLYKLTKYDIRKEKGANLYDYVNKVVGDLINSKTEYWNSKNYKANGVYQRVRAEIHNKYNDIQKSIDPTKPETVVHGLANLRAMYNITATADDHSYIERGTGVRYASTTEFMSERGYGISERRKAAMTALQIERLTRGSNLGSAVHKSLEGQSKDIAIDILKDTGFAVSDDAVGMLKKVLDDIKKTKTPRNGTITALSEVMIADPTLKLAGTIDLILIDNQNRIHIFDFKTKEKGWQYYTSNLYGPSDKEKYHMQLGIYKHMLEKFLNLPVFSMNVVMLKPTVTENVIGSVSLDTTHSTNGLDSFTREETNVRKVLGESARRFNLTTAEANMTADSEYMKSMEYKLKATEADKVSALDKIYNDTIKVLDDKLEIIRKRYAYSKSRSFEEFVTAITQETSPSAALLAVIKYANETTDQLINRYQKMLQKGEPFTPQLLMEWRDYITSYDTLDDLQLLLSNEKNLLGDPGALDVLRKLVSKKKEIQQIFETVGKEAVARRLTPFYNEIKIRRKEELEKKYRILEYRYKKNKAALSQEELALLDKGTTINEFVDTNLRMESGAIEKLTYETLLKELSVAANDVNEITRWIDNMQDTSDPVAGGIVMAFNKADEKSRVEAIDQRIKLVKTLRALEEYKGKTSYTSEKKFYSSILETEPVINGMVRNAILGKSSDEELTNYLLRPWYSKLDEEERAIRKANKTKTDKQAAEDTSAWIDSNFPLESHRDEYMLAFDKYLQESVQDKKITANEKEQIMDNEYFKGAPLTYLARDEYDIHGNLTQEALISEDAADLALTWKGRNRKLYSDINQKWVNPQWAKFMKEVGVDSTKPIAVQMELLRTSANPMAQFYISIIDMAAQADGGLPYSYRLGYRLPGVSKEKNERLREGQSLTTAFKESLEIGFVRRVEDTSYQTKEFTDEKGNPKYFLPIHYTAKLNNDAQSYDLATIYYKYWESANDYANKREILPTLEMAKYFIENRKTERKDSLGKRVMSVVRGNRAVTDSDVSLNNTSNLASQLKDWFEVYIYGNTVKKSEIKISDELVVDGQKLVDGINAFTSVNLLALNVVQGIANIGVGEIFTAIDAMAGEYFTVGSLTKASGYYSKWFPKMIGDIGARTPSHVSTMLIERFNAMNEDIAAEANFANSTRFKALATSRALGFAQNAGEHWLRSRMLFALLLEKKAIGHNGEELGPMIDQYYASNGELKLKKEVDLAKSSWTDEDIEKFTRRFHGIATKVHGAYGQEERVAAQRYIIGKLAYMYRKFAMPGIRRRYGKSEYSERMQQTVEGNYVTTYKFFANLLKDIHSFKLSLMGENWAALSPHEKANIKRTISELAMLTSMVILGNFAYSNWNGEDDDPNDKRFWALMAYQSYRLKSELLFYVSPTNAMQILRSPMASMSVLENLGKTWSQMLNPSEVYSRGPWKGHLKLERDIVQLIPVYKQYYRFRDIEEQIQWFR